MNLLLKLVHRNVPMTGKNPLWVIEINNLSSPNRWCELDLTC